MRMITIYHTDEIIEDRAQSTKSLRASFTLEPCISMGFLFFIEASVASRESLTLCWNCNQNHELCVCADDNATRRQHIEASKLRIVNFQFRLIIFSLKSLKLVFLEMEEIEISFNEVSRFSSLCYRLIA